MDTYICESGHETKLLNLHRDSEPGRYTFCKTCHRVATLIEELDMTRIDPDTLIVKYIDPLVHQRLYKLDFHETYVKALRNALDLVRAGMQKVSIIQKREVLHDHENLVRASENIHRFATDEDLIEQAHHSSYSYDDRLLASAMRNAAHSGVVVWASL